MLVGTKICRVNMENRMEVSQRTGNGITIFSSKSPSRFISKEKDISFVEEMSAVLQLLKHYS